MNEPKYKISDVIVWNVTGHMPELEEPIVVLAIVCDIISQRVGNGFIYDYKLYTPLEFMFPGVDTINYQETVDEGSVKLSGIEEIFKINIVDFCNRLYRQYQMCQIIEK